MLVIMRIIRVSSLACYFQLVIMRIILVSRFAACYFQLVTMRIILVSSFACCFQLLREECDVLANELCRQPFEAVAYIDVAHNPCASHSLQHRGVTISFIL